MTPAADAFRKPTSRTGSGDTEVPPAPAASSSDEAVYRVTVAGVPVGLAKMTVNDFAAVTKLERRQGPPLRPSSLRFDSEDGDRLNIEFTFPRDGALAVGAPEVRFRTEIGEGTIRAAFRLERMMFRGRLAL